MVKVFAVVVGANDVVLVVYAVVAANVVVVEVVPVVMLTIATSKFGCC